MATLQDTGWVYRGGPSPGVRLKCVVTWNESTRAYNVSFSRQCGTASGASGGAWWNDSWPATINTTYANWSGSIKGGTSGVIAGTVYEHSVSGTVPNTANSFDVYVESAGYSWSWTFTVGYGWIAPTQTFTTGSNNTTSGNNSQTTNAAYTSKSWSAGSTPNYAGDSITYTWDKNNQANVGTNASPESLARLCRSSNNDYDGAYTTVYEAWARTGGSGDLYQAYTRKATVDDCGNYLQARIWKYYKDINGTWQQWIQSNGHYIQVKPTLSSNCTLRSKKFYASTPSCVVWRATTFNITNNGYGVQANNALASSSVVNGYSLTNNKMYLTTTTAGEATACVTFGDGAFNANWSLPTSPLDIHTNKINSWPTINSSAFAYTNFFNPRTGETSRLGLLNQDLGTVTVASGSVTLPTIDSVKAVSGTGTTIVVEDSKNVWTNQDNVKITWRVNHSGNSNGFGYDARVNETGHATYGPGKYNATDCSLIPVNTHSWTSPYGATDNTSDSIVIQHDSIPTTGSQRSIVIVPFIRDSANYQIFGEATRSYVTSNVYTMYKITKPNVPTINTWTNTLPAIDGVKDVINYTATSPSSWGNVTDFNYGFKMRYQIGSDTARSDGYQWLFIDTPTTTNTKFSGSLTQTYNRLLNTTCNAQLAATSYFSTVWDAYLDFQSDWSTAKSYNISAKDPYQATSGTLTVEEATTLKTEVPYIFKCPSETINGNTLVQTTTISIDGGTAKSIKNPTYSTSTPDSLTGALTLTFSDLKLETEALARGAHTIVVKNEVATYFDSSTPVTNHVYFGTTTVTSNTVNVEVAELPSKPTLATPNPQYFKAGSHNVLKFTFTANDWGCLDTTYNNRHFDYELIDPKGNVLQSHTLSKTTTSYSYPNTGSALWISPTHEGTYTFRLRQTTVVGSSDWVEKTIEIQKAEEPGNSTFEATNILALSGWSWNLKIKPGTNGSYTKLPTSMVDTRGVFTTNKYLAGGRTLNAKAPNYERALAVYWNLQSQDLTNKTSTVAYTIQGNAGVSGTAVTMTNGKVNLNGSNVYTQSGSTSLDYNTSVKTGTFTVTHNKNYYNVNLGGSRYENLDATFNGDSSATIGGTSVKNIGETFALPATTDSRIEGRYKVDVVLPTYSDNLIGTETFNSSSVNVVNISSYNKDEYLGKDIWYDYGDNTVLTQDTTHIYNDTGNYTIKVYQRVNSGYTQVKNITGWTTINNGVALNRDYVTDFDGYENGLYKVLVQYERNYTAKVVKEQMFFDIIPPEVKLYDQSHIVSCTKGSDVIPFQIVLDVYAGTDLSEAFYSVDYGVTWTKLNQTRIDGAHRYFEKQIDLTWLDEIWLKAHGKNLVSEKTIYALPKEQIVQLNDTNDVRLVFKHEMPSDYKIWLSWNDRKNHKILDDIWVYYIYNHDEMIEVLNQGSVTLSWSGNLQSTTKPSFIWRIIDTSYPTPTILLEMSSSGTKTANVTQTMIDNRDTQMVIGFKATKGEALTACTFTPSVYQTPSNNLFNFRKLPDEYVLGNCIITNNKDGSFTYSRETDKNADLIRRVAMSQKGSDVKKVRHIKKV